MLHAVVREHLASFLEAARDRDGDGYPRFIEHEFDRYLRCGVLAHGFARLRCPACGHERLVGFSCKGRLCPSCTGRRMADIAADLVDHRLPAAPYRQWVLTFPWVLRFRLAVDRPLFSALIRGYLQTLAWQRRRGRAMGLVHGATGGVTFVHRFGSVMNLHPHVHSIVPDGLFTPDGEGALGFADLPAPTPGELEALTERIARRLTTLVERHTADDARTSALMEETVHALREALSSSVVTSRLALDDEPPAPVSPLCARVAGFTLHAAQAVSAEDRAGLERLARYGLRSPFSQERLTRRDDGRVVYTLRRPWPRAGGVTALVLEPHELLRRLAALTPAPYSHLVRYHGIFARRSALRRHLPSVPVPARLKSADAAGEASPPRRRGRLPWAQLLLRVFSIDALRCVRCSTPMVVLALISDPPVMARILTHLGLPPEPPAIAPARPASHHADADFGAWTVDLDEPVGTVFDDAEREPPCPVDRTEDPDEPPP